MFIMYVDMAQHLVAEQTRMPLCCWAYLTRLITSKLAINTSSNTTMTQQALMPKNFHLYFLLDTPKITFGLETGDETLRNPLNSLTAHDGLIGEHSNTSYMYEAS